MMRAPLNIFSALASLFGIKTVGQTDGPKKRDIPHIPFIQMGGYHNPSRHTPGTRQRRRRKRERQMRGGGR